MVHTPSSLCSLRMRSDRFTFRSLHGAMCLVLPVVAATLPAQSATPGDLSRLAKHASVQQAFAALERDNAWTLDQQVSLCEIPAPPFKEAARAAVFRDRLKALGVQQVRIDGEGNVIGEIRGVRAGPTVLLSGHLDTVFPEGTDVRVKRIDFPDDVREKVYERMRAERTRVATELRAQGAEEAEKIRASADREAQVIVATAYGEAERTRGDGDAKSAETFAKAYGRDPEFYRFYRSLQAYRESMRSQDVMVIEPDSEFYRYFKSTGGK